MNKTFITALFFLFALYSCGQTQNQSQNKLQTISPDEFEKQLIAVQGEQLIDVRTPQEFAKYRIQGAQNFDLRNPDFRKQIAKLDTSKAVLVYCLSGARSAAAAAIFQQNGFKAVYNLAGGINAWSAAGKAIDQDLSGKGELPAADYDSITAAKGYVLVDFYAPWCGPCIKMLPVVEDLAKNYSAKFKLLTVNFDQNRLLAKQKNIASVPYLIVFKDGKQIWSKNGDASKEEIMKALHLDK